MVFWADPDNPEYSPWLRSIMFITSVKSFLPRTVTVTPRGLLQSIFGVHHSLSVKVTLSSHDIM